MTTLVLLPGGIALRRPQAVRDVMARLLELDLSGLPRSARAVLLYLGSLINVGDPATPIYPKRATIARETGFSEPTVYRALDTLEMQGWITRDCQRQDADTGLFAESLIRMGEVVTALFAAVRRQNVSPPEQNPSLLVSNEDAASLVESASPESIQKTSHEIPSPTLILQAPLYGEQGSSLKRSNAPAALASSKVSLPAELHFLEQVGRLKPPQVVALMAVAKRHSVWLQDLVAAKSDVIRRGTIRNLFAYLRKLIQSGTDWKWTAKHRDEDVRQAENTGTALREKRAQLAQYAATLAGQVFVNAAGRRFEVDESGQRVVTRVDGCRRVGVIGQAFIDCIADGTLRQLSTISVDNCLDESC